MFGDKTLLWKELRVGTYPLSAFYVSRTVTTMPLEFIWPLFYITIVFWLTNANPAFVVYLGMYFVVMLNVLGMQAVGLAISAGVPAKHQVTTTLLLITFYFGYSGMFMPLDQLPDWLSWVHHGNLLMYGYFLNLQVLFTDSVEFTCRPPEDGLSDYAPCLADSTYKITRSDILARFNIFKSAETCIMVAVIHIFLFHAIAYFFLRKEVKSSL